MATDRAWLKPTWTRLRAGGATFGRIVRATQWWDYKLIPMFSIFYATALVQLVPIASIWPAAIALLLAVAPCAAYVSLVNDVTDRADDHRAGKTNRLAGKPGRHMALLLAAPLCVAVVFSIVWRDDLPLITAYLCAFAAFSLYSVPPFRLKGRGILGVIADASGAHLFPTLVAALLAFRAAGKAVDPVWIGAAAAWALGCGLRGILWHQLYDQDGDRKAAVQTFVVRHSARSAVRLAAYLALPMESVGLAVLLWRMQTLWPVLLLLLYGAFATLRARMWNVVITIAEPYERYAILGQEYYTLLFPLGILLSSALRHPADWAVLIAHLLVFPTPAVSVALQAYRLMRELAQSKR
jgi:1,4-dihydroxy-2-naphthoate octaprenyltransferase